jgi:hypothetical protein
MDDETTPWKKTTRKELYEKFPYLRNRSMKEMILIVSECFKFKCDSDLIYAIKCYMHSYPELSKEENFHKIFLENE